MTSDETVLVQSTELMLQYIGIAKKRSRYWKKKCFPFSILTR
eukprot:CAMPEP_0196822638 /NCGR_PEP_ID=MMETSP1362-20130617/84135_1 /TAXON_ID=163516 /ORGANISM="Leptocylindrus danicus, Strain CCMP1856" /LENGTH=41 /DNA_ID= /DNA_START= /DNA_END= /DNA_ORIENTATION=